MTMALAPLPFPPAVTKYLNTPEKQYGAVAALVLAVVFRKKLKKMF